MENVLLAVSLLSCVALIVAVLLQRSEGGALGMGGGGAGGGLVSGRGAADTLVKATMVLAAIFFCASLALTRINADKSKGESSVERTIDETGLGAGVLDDIVSESQEESANSDLISEALEESDNDIESAGTDSIEEPLEAVTDSGQ